jgi:hypothetical protein
MNFPSHQHLQSETLLTSNPISKSKKKNGNIWHPKSVLIAILHRLVIYYKHLIGPPTPSQGLCAQLRSISMTQIQIYIVAKYI